MSLIDSWCIKSNVDCLYYLKDYALNNDFEKKNGFVDLATRIELKKSLIGHKTIILGENKDVKLEILEPKSLKSINPEALMKFNQTRFYRDNNFKKELVLEMYLIWVENHIKAKNADVIGAIYKNQIIGLITYEFLNNNIPKIGLFSVQKSIQNLGIGSQLLKQCIKNLINKKKKKLFVVTQKSNSKALKFYLKNGFKIESKYKWFHKWYKH